MAVSVYPVPSTGGGGVDANGKWWYYPTANTTQLIDGPFSASVYRMVTNTGTINVTFVSAAYLPIATISVSTTPVYYNLAETAAQLQVSGSTANVYVNVTDLDTGTYGTPIAVTQVTTSGQVTLNSTLSKVVIIGGGAAGTGTSVGGGSGRFAQGDFGPGTYSLTIGAGGTGGAGGAGGTTTFGNLSAAGGNGSSGGSGASGFRGNNGSGTGTGTTPDLRFPTAAQGGNNGSYATFGGAGGGGGVYAGGGNGGYFANSPQTGGTGSAGGGGGGAGANAANGSGSGGNGGPGILYYLELEA